MSTTTFVELQEESKSSVSPRNASAILSDHRATLGVITRAQNELDYSQHSATLTWQNVSCGNYINTKLFPVCGYIKPGQMLCVLGGGDDSGISDLFKILRDPTYIYNVKNKQDFIVQGNILLNSLPPNRFYKRAVAFIPKTDNHLATLTVGETMLFSAKMRSPAHMTDEHIERSVDTVLGWLGLTETHKNTYVGDANLKGISGGQKRRLSIGVEVVAGSSICIAELPTNGLDAKTAFEVVNAAKHIAETGNKSMMMSLAQPSPELFDLFDNCCLMAFGECFYFGPQSKVQSYLIDDCKLIQPPNKSLPAWIEELTVKPLKFMSDELKSDILKSKKDDRISDRHIIVYLAKKYRNSKYFEDVAHSVLRKHIDENVNDDTIISDFEDLDRAVNQNGQRGYAYSYDLRGLEHGYGTWKLPKLITPSAQIKQIAAREFLATSRNRHYIYSRLFQSLIVGLCLGIVFWQLPQEPADMRSRVGALFFIIGFMGFGAVPFIHGLATQLTVFYDQKHAGYVQCVTHCD